MIFEKLTKVLKTIGDNTEELCNVLKQHNAMLLDLYERIAKLEGQAGIKPTPIGRG